MNMMKSQRENLIRLFWSLCSTLAIFGLVFLCAMSVGVGGNELPKIEVWLADGVTLEEINENGKDVRYEGNFLKVTDGYGRIKEYRNVEIKGRGNMTWSDAKKPYRIKLDSKTDFLGMGEMKKWVLLTYNLDDSLMRGDIGVLFAKMIDDEYPLEGKFVELVVNDEKIGVYYLMKPVSISKYSVNLSDPAGIIVELDNAYYGSEETYLETELGDHLVLKDVVSDGAGDEAFKDFTADYNTLQKAARLGDYDLVCEVADIDSFVEYALFSEFIGNYDAYVTSFFMYKDGEIDKIHAGPMWDFDATFGNRNWGEWNEEFYEPTSLMPRRAFAMGGVAYDERSKKVEYVEPDGHLTTLMYDLMKIDRFQELVKNKYIEKLHGRKTEVWEYIDRTANRIKKAAQENNLMWGNGDFQEEVEYLKWWIDERLKIFDTMYGLEIMVPSEHAEAA